MMSQSRLRQGTKAKKGGIESAKAEMFWGRQLQDLGDTRPLLVDICFLLLTAELSLSLTTKRH